MSLLHYPTVKYVYLPDKRLGTFYYSCVALVLISCMSTIFMHKGYLVYDTQPLAANTPRISQRHTWNDSSPLPEYCVTPRPKGCPNTCTCKEWNPTKLVYPPPMREVCVTTYVEDFDHTEQEEKFFTLGPERLFIKLDHAIASSALAEYGDHSTQELELLQAENLGGSARNMRGYLLGHDGNVLQTYEPYSEKLDRISIHDLLQAAGLEKGLETPSWRNQNKTLRRTGAVMHVTISYENSHLTLVGTHQIEYFIQAAMHPFMEHQSTELITDAAGEEHVRKRIGLRIEIHQRGKLGKFSLGALAGAIGGGVGMLWLVALITDYAAVYLFRKQSHLEHQVVMYDRFDEQYRPLSPLWTSMHGTPQSHPLPDAQEKKDK